jgi:predicted secreted protein
MAKSTGRDFIVSFAVANEDASVGSLTFKRLGMLRGKEFNTTWDTVDTTGDTSPDFTRTSLVTFKTVTFNGDAVLDSSAAENQSEFQAAVVSPGVSTSYQPKVWFKLEGIDGVYTGPFLVTSFSQSASFDAERTWSFESTSNGAVTFVPA